jgi:glycine hydroxymethyltransferase
VRDKIIRELIEREARRQQKTTNLIASENFVSEDVLKALGSVFTNKYAEGYPGRRYYGGNKIVDELENLVKTRALKLFIRRPVPPAGGRRQWSVNVQPYSGSPANLAVYFALVPLGGKIMGLSLDMGGHLSHGHKVSVTGKLWKWIHCILNPKTEQFDYPAILKLAKKEKPKLIVTGYTAYSRIIDFKKFRRIANACGALLMVDMSHFAGLVAGGVYSSPFPYADVVMTTTHKTLRGPRAALIFSRKEYSKQIDKTVFPGLQGGPHANQIAATAVALYEVMQPSFRRYAKQVVKNAKVLASELQKLGWRIVSGGTDTHLFLVDTMARGISGKQASEKLEKAGIIVNKNTIPYDKRSPVDPSGIRIGTPAVTSRGMKEKDMKKLAQKINNVLLK